MPQRVPGDSMTFEHAAPMSAERRASVDAHVGNFLLAIKVVLACLVFMRFYKLGALANARRAHAKAAAVRGGAGAAASGKAAKGGKGGGKGAAASQDTMGGAKTE